MKEFKLWSAEDRFRYWKANELNVLAGLGFLQRGGDYGLDTNLGGLALDQYINGDIEGIINVALHGLARILPRVRNLSQRALAINPDLEIIGIGAESISVKYEMEDGETIVKKYMAGKTMEPAKLYDGVNRRLHVAKHYMGRFITSTEVTREKVELWRGRELEYVTLTQPYLDISVIDPQNRPQLLKDDEYVREENQQLISSAKIMTDDVDHIMDWVQQGNNAMARPFDDEGAVYTAQSLDPVPAIGSDKNIYGFWWSPGWNTDRYISRQNEFYKKVYIEPYLDSEDLKE